MVLKTTSVSRTVDRPGEHLIAVVFPRPAYIEVAFARFELGMFRRLFTPHLREKIGD